MKRLVVLAALSAALATSACITVIDATDGGHHGWHGENAQPFDAARDACHNATGKDRHSSAFRDCMAQKGWTRR